VYNPVFQTYFSQYQTPELSILVTKVEIYYYILFDYWCGSAVKAECV